MIWVRKKRHCKSRQDRKEMMDIFDIFYLSFILDEIKPFFEITSSDETPISSSEEYYSFLYVRHSILNSKIMKSTGQSCFATGCNFVYSAYDLIIMFRDIAIYNSFCYFPSFCILFPIYTH